MRSFGSCAIAILVAALLGAVPRPLRAQEFGSAALLSEVSDRERVLRQEFDARRSPASAPLQRRARLLVGAYEDIARVYPSRSEADDASWRAAALAADTYWQFGDSADRSMARRLLSALIANHPSSPFVSSARDYLGRLSRTVSDASSGRAGPAASLAPVSRPRGVATGATGTTATVTSIRHDLLPDAVRVTLELDRETPFRDIRPAGLGRIEIELTRSRPSRALIGAALAYRDEVVREVRVGQEAQPDTRVVIGLDAAAGRYSVYPLYDPFRVVIDVERRTGPAPAPVTREARRMSPLPGRPIPLGLSGPVPLSPSRPPERGEAVSAAPVPPSAGRRGAPPAAAATNSTGSFSLARQLGLGVGRIVIDPGHGGHDPGAQVSGLDEASLVLDVALRLERLLLKQPGVEVVMVRRDDVFVPLEERTALANREGADLFLSIHANASADARARGVETYYLNFAPNPQAEAVAARENAGSVRTMRNLPDLVKAIALNTKRDESRDFASLVQAAMVERLKAVNKAAKDLGVKQAPFVVLVGATMPSVLAEISFVTHRQEAALLKTGAYRQRVAEALLAGVMRYQRSLKVGAQVATK